MIFRCKAFKLLTVPYCLPCWNEKKCSDESYQRRKLVKLTKFEKDEKKIRKSPSSSFSSFDEEFQPTVRDERRPIQVNRNIEKSLISLQIGFEMYRHLEPQKMVLLRTVQWMESKLLKLKKTILQVMIIMLIPKMTKHHEMLIHFADLFA